ncbi:hypothetical protein Tco_0477218, partial [Tanacetum coccineum]
VQRIENKAKRFDSLQGLMISSGSEPIIGLAVEKLPKGKDEKKRLDRLKQDQEILVIKIFSERKKVFRERKKCEKIQAKRDCMVVVKEIVSRLLEEVEKLEWWFEQDIDDEEEEDEEGEGGSEV